MKVLLTIPLWIIACAVPSVVGYIDFRAEPRVIILGSTNLFTLTCTYKYTGISAIKNVTYIEISKETTPDELRLLAFIERIPDEAEKSTIRTDDRTYGHFDKGKTSSLTVRFKGPAFQRNETYVCVVRGRDENDEMFQSVESVYVMLKDASTRPIDQERLFYAPEVYNDALYFLSRETVTTYAQAVSYCHRIGGYLIEVDDADELKMAERLSRFHMKRSVFIAGSDQEVEGHWIFPRTERNVTFFNWARNQPDDYHGEDCRAIQYYYLATKLNDFPCFIDWTVNFMCEVKFE